MANQTRVHPEARRREMDELADEDIKATGQRASDRDTVEDIDDLLDEIDSVLEENALAFMTAYVQKGGQ
jgi:ubiquitin-like protein Pup